MVFKYFKVLCVANSVPVGPRFIVLVLRLDTYFVTSGPWLNFASMTV